MLTKRSTHTQNSWARQQTTSLGFFRSPHPVSRVVLCHRGAKGPQQGAPRPEEAGAHNSKPRHVPSCARFLTAGLSFGSAGLLLQLLAPQAAQAFAGFGVHPTGAAHVIDWLLVAAFAYYIKAVLFDAHLHDNSQDGRNHTNSSGSLSNATSLDSPGTTHQGGRLSGAMTHAQYSSYVSMANSSNGYNPDMMALRNKALATAASYSVSVALKESRPRIHQLLTSQQAGALECPTPQETTSSSQGQEASVTGIRQRQHVAVSAHTRGSPSHPRSASGTMPSPLNPSPAPSQSSILTATTSTMDDTAAGAAAAGTHESLDEGALADLVLQELCSQHRPTTTEGVTGYPGGDGPGPAQLAGPQLEQMEQHLLKVVAERAALEQIESVIRVVAESHQTAATAAGGGGGVAGQGGQAGGGRSRGRGSSNDIRGGGAL